MKDMQSRYRLPMNLQFFAEESQEDPKPVENDPAPTEDPKPEPPKPVSFDDFLKDGKNQAEFDRRVQSAIDTAVSKAREKWQIMADDKATEAKKLEKMSADEKAEYQRQKRIKELDEREAEITRRELMATAKNTLADKGLPQELASILTYTDAKACSASIEAVEKAFSAAVEAAVKDRVKGGEPIKKAQGSEAAEEIMAKTIRDNVLKGWS